MKVASTLGFKVIILWLAVVVSGCVPEQPPEEENTNSEADHTVFLNSITAFSLAPSDSVSIEKDFASTEPSYAPELLGSNTLSAHYSDGSNEALACWGNHYNPDLSAHILHCTSPSQLKDVFLGLTSSDATVITFTSEWNDSYDQSYWKPLKEGTTTITGTLLFVEKPVTFNVYVTLTAAQPL